MKKLTAMLIAVAMVGAMNLSLPTAAHASAKDEVEQCRTLVALNIFETQGDCVSNLRTQAPRICRQLRDSNSLAFFGWNSVGECVRAFRAFT